MSVLSYVEKDNQFYPTPAELANHIKRKYFDGSEYKKVLDPSAGKGDLIAPFHRSDLYAVEIDPNLTHILEGKGVSVIGNDWLAYDGTEVFDAVVMNPPFLNGAKHALKAIDLYCRLNTKFLCILNASTVKNPNNNYERDLVSRIKDYGASVEYMQGAFSQAERKTNVEIAIVCFEFKMIGDSFDDLLDDMGFAKEESFIQDDNNELEKRESIDAFRLVKNYKEDVESIRKITSAFTAMTRRAPVGLSLTSGDKSVNGNSCDGDVTEFLNTAIKRTRSDYWDKIFDMPQLSSKLTRDDTSSLREFLSKNEGLDFTLDNIYSLIDEVMKRASKSVEDSIVSLFDSITNRHSYHDEWSKSTHLYDGWKTNAGASVKNKFILPIRHSFMQEKYGISGDGMQWEARERLRDVEICFGYFTDIKYESMFSGSGTQAYRLKDDFGNVKDEYESDLMYIKFYKKGTAHIIIKDDDALRRFNIFVGKKLNMLPPNYGQSKYDDMSEEDQNIVKSFEGKKSYKVDTRGIKLLGD